MKFKEASQDTRNFLKLKSGESIGGIFRGDPYDFRTHWADNRSIVCPGKENCDLCKQGKKSAFRFRVNFIVKDGEELVAKVFEQGWTVYEAMRALNDNDYDLEKYKIKITRHGTGIDTTYSIIPIPNGLVTPDVEAKLKAVKLNDLSHVTPHENEPPPHTDDDKQYEDIPF